MLVFFVEGDKNGEPREKPLEQVQQQEPTTNSTHMWHQDGLGHIGGKQAPPLHPCSPGHGMHKPGLYSLFPVRSSLVPPIGYPSSQSGTATD